VLTILRAYHVPGRPGRPTPLGSFEAWSDLVRGALLWLGCDDPVDGMDSVRESDPRRAGLQTVMVQWEDAIGSERVTVAEAIKLALGHPDFREALLTVACEKGAINGRRLEKWLGGNKDRILGGRHFRQLGIRQGLAAWALCKAD
jgi:putative DNA primase/helicase